MMPVTWGKTLAHHQSAPAVHHNEQQEQQENPK
jgi:hypothetical protein